MTDPFAAAVTAAQTAQAAGAALQQQLAADTTQLATDQATITAQAAQIATLEAELHPTPATAWGANASNTAQHTATVTLLHPTVWRYYQQPGEPIAWPKEYALGPGEILAYSDKQPIPDKAAGAADATFTAFCKAAPTDRDTYYCPLHEHDAKIAQGEFTAAQYVAAFQRLAAIAHATSPRIKMVPIYTDYCFKPASGRNWRDTWPGDCADAFGVDPYVWGYTPASAIPTLLDAASAAAAAAGRPLGIFETGVDKTAFTGQARLDALTGWARTIHSKKPAVVCYFGAVSNGPWTLDAAAAAAWLAGQPG